MFVKLCFFSLMKHRHICTCEFCLRHDFWIYGFSKIWHYDIHFHKIRKTTFSLHEPNECAESTGHSNWRTFHTAHICKLLCLNEPLKEKNWYNIFIPILEFKISSNLAIFFNWQTKKKNRSFVFFFNNLNWEKFVGTNWWNHLMNSLNIYL